MTILLLPCYGGPYDGRFYPENKPPIGYKKFTVRKNKVWLWKTIKIERLDFNVLAKSSRTKPEEFDGMLGKEWEEKL